MEVAYTLIASGDRKSELQWRVSWTLCGLQLSSEAEVEVRVKFMDATKPAASMDPPEKADAAFRVLREAMCPTYGLPEWTSKR